MNKEYVLWGTKDGDEEPIRVNGQEVQKSQQKAKQIKKILEKRGTFDSIRIQTIDKKNYDIKSDFMNTLR